MRTNDPNARHSGRFMLRMPHELHDKLSRLAAEQGVSLNQLAVALLSSGAAWRADKDGVGGKSGLKGGAVAVTDKTNDQLALGDARALSRELVRLIEDKRLSVAQAARATGVPVEVAGLLARLRAIELEADETELDERLEDMERQCPGEDWWSYTDRQHSAIFLGSAIPNRIVRELVEEWQRRTGQGTTALAAIVGITDEALRRSLGMVAVPGRIKHGRRYPRQTQKTIQVEAAGRIVRALGIPPCEVCGL